MQNWIRTARRGLTVVLCAVSLCAQARDGGHGTVRDVGQGEDTIRLVRVGGTRYEMGYWYGKLLADDIAGCWRSFSSKPDVAITLQLGIIDSVLDRMWDPAHFPTAAYDEELRGVADGCADAGRPEIDEQVLKSFLVFPDWSEAVNCSLFVAWGRATVDGDLWQLRNLDWRMDLGVQQYPVVAIFEPDDGHKHALVGFAGVLGMVGGGINEHGLAQSEIMGSFGDPETLRGVPFPILLRESLYHDSTLAEALTRIAAAPRTCEYYYGLGGRDVDGVYRGRLLFTSRDRCDIFSDTDVTANAEYPGIPHPVVEDVVYWSRHSGRLNPYLHDAIREDYGNIDAAASQRIALVVEDPGEETLLSVIYNATRREFWVAFAEGDHPSTRRSYVHFSLDEEP